MLYCLDWSYAVVLLYLQEVLHFSNIFVVHLLEMQQITSCASFALEMIDEYKVLG